jgi:hypothetical protein
MNELTHAHHLQQQQQSRAGVPPLPMAASTADRSKPQRCVSVRRQIQ